MDLVNSEIGHQILLAVQTKTIEDLSKINEDLLKEAEIQKENDF